MKAKFKIKSILLMLIFSLLIQSNAYAFDSKNEISIERLEDNVIEVEEVKELLKHKKISNRNNSDKMETIESTITMIYDKLKYQEAYIKKYNGKNNEIKFPVEYKTFENLISRYSSLIIAKDDKNNTILDEQIKRAIYINDSIKKQVNELAEYEKLLTTEINNEIKNSKNMMETENKIKPKRELVAYVRDLNTSFKEINGLLESMIINTFDFDEPESVEIKSINNVTKLIEYGYDSVGEGPEFEELNLELDLQLEKYETQKNKCLSLAKSNTENEQETKDNLILKFFKKTKEQEVKETDKQLKLETMRLNLIELNINHLLMQKQQLQ